MPARWVDAADLPAARKIKLRFAVASDLHYGQENTPFDEVTSEMVTWINREKASKGLDAVFLNGDLTNDVPAHLRMFEVLGQDPETGGLLCCPANQRVKEGNFMTLTILQHPSNPDYPSRWFTRNYGFLSPTPIYWPENNRDTRLAKGEVMSLRYRVLIFSGKPDFDADFAKFSE